MRLILLVALVATAVSASTVPISGQRTFHAPVHGANITQPLFDEFSELAQIVDIAYCVGTLNTGIEPPFKCLSFCELFPDFTLIQTWNTGLTL